MNKVDRKITNMAKSMSIQRSHTDLEFLIFRWSTKSHTFTPTWGRPTLEDIVDLMCLPMFGESQATGIILNEKDKKKLEFMNKASKKIEKEHICLVVEIL